MKQVGAAAGSLLDHQPEPEEQMPDRQMSGASQQLGRAKRREQNGLQQEPTSAFKARFSRGLNPPNLCWYQGAAPKAGDHRLRML